MKEDIKYINNAGPCEGVGVTVKCLRYWNKNYNVLHKIPNNDFFPVCICRKNGALESCQVAYSTCSNLCQQQTKSCFSCAVQLELKRIRKNRESEVLQLKQE